MKSKIDKSITCSACGNKISLKLSGIAMYDLKLVYTCGHCDESDVLESGRIIQTYIGKTKATTKKTPTKDLPAEKPAKKPTKKPSPNKKKTPAKKSLAKKTPLKKIPKLSTKKRSVESPLKVDQNDRKRMKTFTSNINEQGHCQE